MTDGIFHNDYTHGKHFAGIQSRQDLGASLPTRSSLRDAEVP